MRLVCPSCEAAYNVPDDRLGPGPRRLRCARCAHIWTVMPPPPAPPLGLLHPEPATPPPANQSWPAPPPLTAETRRPLMVPLPDYEDEEEEEAPASHWGVTAAWFASVLLLVGLVVAAVHFQTEIMQVWPPSQRLYAVFNAAQR